MWLYWRLGRLVLGLIKERRWSTDGFRRRGGFGNCIIWDLRCSSFLEQGVGGQTKSSIPAPSMVSKGTLRRGRLDGIAWHRIWAFSDQVDRIVFGGPCLRIPIKVFTI